jgi:hypothetical protein
MTMGIITDHPIAIGSYDHENPKGALDQQGHEGLEFFAVLKTSYPDIKTVLDVGTAAGWFVYNGVRSGFDIYGIEGTDKADAATPWVLYKNVRLFHADLRYPFYLFNHTTAGGQRALSPLFDLVTAWDVLEHLTEEGIDNFLKCIYMMSRKYFMATIEFTEENNEGYHILCRPREWWVEKFKDYGFIEQPFDQIVQRARFSPEENCFILKLEK